MKSERKKRTITLSILIITVLAISVGFAAYSATLKINSSMIVNPDNSRFKVLFSSSANALETNAVKANPSNMGDDATIDNTTVPTIEGLTAKFTQPGESVTYTFYVRNEGGYVSYLNSISFRGIKCIPGEGTSDALANRACNSITTTISVGNITTNETITDITGETLVPGETKQVTVTIAYDPNGARADGPFIAEFGNISMFYATENGMNEDIEYVCNLTRDMYISGQIDIKDEVTCGTESFYVIPNDPVAHPTATGNNVTLLAKYNLNVGNDLSSGTTGIQNSEAKGYLSDNYESCNFSRGTWDQYRDYSNWLDFYKDGYGCNGSMSFSELNYWGDVANHTFVYNSFSLLYPHVENYRKYMENLGASIKDASLASYNQIEELGDVFPSNFNYTYFWLGSVNDVNNVDVIYNGINYASTSFRDYEEGYFAGVRPVIIISKSDIGIPKN